MLKAFRSHRFMVSSASFVFLFAIASNAASAETVPGATDEAQTSALGDIIVTANKRSERLQDVPAAISAMSAEQVQANRVVDVYSLATSTPSFNITQDSAVSQQLNIRGIVSVKLNDASAEPSVGMFVDDVYISRMGSASTDFFDLERIEVIRGPQGVLLGKSVAGGAISVISAKPEFNNAAQATVSYGNYNSVMANGYITGALSDRIAGRFSFQVRNRDGYNKNVRIDRELDNLNSYQMRGQLLYENEDSTFRALLSANYSFDKSNGTIRAAVDDPAIPGLGTLAVYRAANGIGPREDFSPQAEYVNRWSFGTHLRIDWDVISGATLTSVTGFRDSSADWTYNQIGTGSPPAAVDTFIINSEMPRTFSQELRLASNNSASALDWMVGAYYQHDRILRPYQHIASSSAGIAVFSGHSFYDASANISTSAVFGQVGYEFGNGFKLTGGVRYTHDAKSGSKTVTCLEDGGDGACVSPLKGPKGTKWTVNYDKTWDSVTPQAILEYRPNQQVMVYASYAKGFKGGGWDFIPPTPVAATIPYNPEHTSNYELGVKTDLFDQHLRFNVSAFQMDLTDLQAQRTDLTCFCLITSNAGKARIKGVEIESVLSPLEGLTFTGSASFIDPKYIDYDDKAGHVYNGKTMQRTPKTKFNLGAEYTANLAGSDKSLTARVNYTHQSKIFWNPDNISFEPGYGLVDASLRLAADNKRWAVTVWGKNLSNKLYSQLGLPFLGDLVNVWGAPRTYGVDLTYSF